MAVPFLDLRRQHAPLSGEVEAAVREVLLSGRYILDKQVRAFEEEFAAYLGCRYALGVGNGLEALLLALEACGIGPGDEVITVPNTAVATVLAISWAGATPVFVDIDPQTYTLDPAHLEEKLTPRTRAILPVHLFGHAADMDAIASFAQRHGLLVIEDACQAHGAEFGGRKLGTLGEVGCFSFYPTKNLGALGDGGMVVTSDEEVARQVARLRNYGQVDRYVHAVKGINSRLDELQAAILRVKLRYLDAWNEERRHLAQMYAQLLGGGELALPVERPRARHVYHLYVVRTSQRDALAEFLDSLGIGALIHYPIPIHLQQAYSDLGLEVGTLPVSEQVAREIVSLPLFPGLTEAEVREVAQAVHAFFRVRV